MNPSLVTLCLGGGLFAIMVMVHMFVDFVCQTHFEAMNKHNNAKIRMRHCLIYTIGFVPLLLLLGYFNALTGWEVFAACNILFWSHFVEDTYIPVYLWAKYIRKPDEMTNPWIQTLEDGQIETLPPDPKKGFVMFVQTTLGKILMIAIDQIIHFCFLIPIVWMALN